MIHLIGEFSESFVAEHIHYFRWRGRCSGLPLGPLLNTLPFSDLCARALPRRPSPSQPGLLSPKCPLAHEGLRKGIRPRLRCRKFGSCAATRAVSAELCDLESGNFCPSLCPLRAISGFRRRRWRKIAGSELASSEGQSEKGPRLSNSPSSRRMGRKKGTRKVVKVERKE